ncbi:MAG: hypothetical protein K0S63_238, partial [Gammaproteobacteria bacterium]|nr:hypothetical protein [Gammaproteobacteria bacterium]
MKKFAIIILLSLFAIPAFAAKKTDATPDLATLQKEMKALQVQIDELNKSHEAEKAERIKTTESIIELSTEDPYGLMSKPIFGLMPRPGFAYNALKAKKELDSPIVLGGVLQTDHQVWGGHQIASRNLIPGGSNPGPYYKGSTVGLSNALLFTTANINEYTTGLFSMGLFAPTNDIEIDRGMIIFGNLEKTPVYLTVGRNFLPWGVFPGNAFLNNPVSTNVMRPLPVGQATLSYAKNGLFGDVGVYQSNALSRS